MDSKDHSRCAGECATFWPPVLLAPGQKVPVGIGVSGLGSFTRSNGTRQVTLYGVPLYRFVGDKKPGQVTGNCEELIRSLVVHQSQASDDSPNQTGDRWNRHDDDVTSDDHYDNSAPHHDDHVGRGDRVLEAKSAGRTPQSVGALGGKPLFAPSWPVALGEALGDEGSLTEAGAGGVALLEGGVSTTGGVHGAGDGTGVTPCFRCPIPAPSMIELGMRKRPSSVITVT